MVKTQKFESDRKRPPATKQPSDPTTFLDKVGVGRTIADYKTGDVVFSQGDPAHAIFHIKRGKVKLSVVSDRGKEAVLALLTTGDFVGEGCLAGQQVRMSTASAMTECLIVRLEKSAMIRALHAERSVSEIFLSHVLARTIRIEEDLVDQLAHSAHRGHIGSLAQWRAIASAAFRMGTAHELHRLRILPVRLGCRAEAKILFEHWKQHRLRLKDLELHNITAVPLGQLATEHRFESAIFFTQ